MRTTSYDNLVPQKYFTFDRNLIRSHYKNSNSKSFIVFLELTFALKYFTNRFDRKK